MDVGLSLQLGGAAAVYVLWLATWLVLGAVAFGPAHGNWDQTLVAVAGAMIAVRAARHGTRPYPVFLGMIASGLVMLAVSWATYNPDSSLALRLAGAGEPDASTVSYALFVFIWVCAWGYLALEQWQRRPPSMLTMVVFVVLIVGLAVILAAFYYPLYRTSIDTNAGRLDAVTSALEFAALIAGLACILLGEPAAVTWMIIATALLLASDMAYSETDVPGEVPAVWMLGQFLLLGALLALPAAAGGRSSPTAPPFGSTARTAPPRSGLSGVLILVSIGCVLLSATLGLIPMHPIWKSFFSVLFVVAVVIAMVWLTDRFDDAVRYLTVHTAKLLRRPLRAEEWRDAETPIRTALESTGLGIYLDSLHNAAHRLQQDVLFVGPERLYPVPRPSTRDRIRCFLVMPFSLEWSDDVHRTVAAACRAMSVHPVRGDDLFTPTDILVDIWHSINGADFVIADITGRNPNVFYELGIAHTLGKPVLIISRTGEDIPIDLSTRRVILYGQPADDWRRDLDDKVTRTITEIIELYGLGSPGGPTTAGTTPTAAGPSWPDVERQSSRTTRSPGN